MYYIYRPPSSSSSWLDSFFAAMSKLSSLYPTITITGDFNIDLLKSTIFSDGLSSDLGNQENIRRPTRVTNNSATLIDHIYSCNADVTYADACNLNLADHFVTICCMSCSSTEAGISLPHRLHTYRSFKSFDAEVLKHDPQSYPWNVVTIISNIDDKVQSFKIAFLDIWNKNVSICLLVDIGIASHHR